MYVRNNKGALVVDQVEPAIDDGPAVQEGVVVAVASAGSSSSSSGAVVILGEEVRVGEENEKEADQAGPAATSKEAETAASATTNAVEGTFAAAATPDDAGAGAIDSSAAPPGSEGAGAASETTLDGEVKRKKLPFFLFLFLVVLHAFSIPAHFVGRYQRQAPLRLTPLCALASMPRAC